MSRQVVIAFGSNLGDRAQTITDASQAISELDGIELVRMSSLYESAALKPDGIDETAPEYLNAVGLFNTDLSATEVLSRLAQIEHDFGRIRAERWGDRTLDLDIIWMEDTTHSTAELTVPHPRAAERSFVLVPWREIQPQAELGGVSVTELAAGIDTELKIYSPAVQVNS